MLDLLRKSFLAGLGAVVVTADKVREATKKLVEEGKISTDEAEKLTEDLVQSGQKQWDEISARLQSSMQKWSENIEMVRKKEFQELHARVEMLEQRIGMLESAKVEETGAATEHHDAPPS